MVVAALRAAKPAAPIASLPANTITQPCPESSDAGGTGGPADVTRVEPMLGQVLAYGGEHADVFGTYGLIWHDSEDVSAFISFTTDVDHHRDELRSIVEYPDELIVCQAPVTGDVASGIAAQLTDELAGRFQHVGLGGDRVEVALNADEAELAGQLVARYGPAVEVTVGALAYPMSDATSTCGPAPAGETIDGLVIEVVPPPGPISATATSVPDLSVRLTNHDGSQITFGSGAARATILDTAGNVVATSANVLAAAVGIGVDLGPGESVELPLVVGLASCNPDIGYTIPAGEYQIVADVQHSDGDVTFLRSIPLTISITD